ncbi:MAG: hypothetical protein Q9183_002163 [Haloplaca sp. 2 TL-2023]
MLIDVTIWLWYHRPTSFNGFTIFLIPFLGMVLPLVYINIAPKSQRHDPLRPRGCKMLGRVFRDGTVPWNRNQARRRRRNKRNGGVSFVEGLYVHPIKSCRAVELDEAEVVPTGLRYDREYSFAEYEGESVGWKFVTQRTRPYLANIEVEIWVPDPDSPGYSTKEPNVQSKGVLLVRYPAPPGETTTKQTSRVFQIPYDPTPCQIRRNGYTMERMKIWKDRPDALLIASTLNTKAPAWLRDIKSYVAPRSSKPFALFRTATGLEREVFRNAPDKGELGYQSVVGFADAYPLHILGLESVADLDNRLAEKEMALPGSTALRFRANIYFSGLGPYAEDDWKRIQIGEYIFHVACRTVRCPLPHVDQSTGINHKSEPTQTLKGYRCIDEGAGPSNTCMGMMMVPALDVGVIKVGDVIEVLETGSHYYIPQKKIETA